MASNVQPGGPAWFVSEFGATSDPSMLSAVTAEMDAQKVGWIYWAWKYYGDPTGSADESLVKDNGHLRSTAMVLSQTYPEAVAGVPSSFSYSPVSDVFNLAYVPNHRIHAPTVVFVPTELHYPNGYCARVSGARVTSRSGSDQLLIKNARSGHSVTVSVTPGRCAPATQRGR